jgi:spore maturation protein CgeB
MVFVGLTISSSWGNGHATTFRSLLRGLAKLGHRLTFLERDVPWYADNRDLAQPDFCDLRYYTSVAELGAVHAPLLKRADVVVIGSYVPDGRQVVDAIAGLATGQFCFYDIDTPVTLAMLESGTCDYLARRQVPLFDVYFSFSGGATLHRLATAFGTTKAAPLYGSVDTERYFPTGEAAAWDLGYLGTYSADRQPALERLLLDVARRLPDRKFVVAGPQYPADIAWPENVERIAHLPPAEHASFYSRQRYTLNVTRSDMISAGWSPSVRLFEAAACRTPVISDRWEGLEHFFHVEESIHVADRTSDVIGILCETPEPAREAMASAAFAAVAQSHTGDARARDFLAGLSSHDFDQRKPSCAA